MFPRLISSTRFEKGSLGPRTRPGPRLGPEGFVTEVAEKKPISNIATVGVYYWKKGSDYVKYAKRMIKNNIRTNNEFYVCPVYNEAIKDKKNIISYQVDKMWGLGTPEDLKNFQEFYFK